MLRTNVSTPTTVSHNRSKLQSTKQNSSNSANIYPKIYPSPEWIEICYTGRTYQPGGATGRVEDHRKRSTINIHIESEERYRPPNHSWPKTLQEASNIAIDMELWFCNNIGSERRASRPVPHRPTPFTPANFPPQYQASNIPRLPKCDICGKLGHT